MLKIKKGINYVKILIADYKLQNGIIAAVT